MKYSFVRKNKFENKKYLLEYDQFADDEEYDSDDTYDQEVSAMIDKKAAELKYKLKNMIELSNILYGLCINKREQPVNANK